MNIHVTLVPYIKAARELKTKPTQQSVAKLREIGLQPQVLMCRTEHPLDAERASEAFDVLQRFAGSEVIEVRDVEHTCYETATDVACTRDGLDA